MAKIFAIVAMDENRLIGGDGTMPWHLPEDLKNFASLTTGHTVLMGRKTYESLPKSFRPLPNRDNVVATRTGLGELTNPNVKLVDDAAAYLESVASGNESLPTDILWVVGGGKIYELSMPYWERVYLTKVDGSHEGDVFFPEFEEHFDLLEEVPRDGFSFLTYERS